MSDSKTALAHTGPYFFCGIGGSGMLPLSLIVKGRGYDVEGSDRSLDAGRTASKFDFLKARGIARLLSDRFGQAAMEGQPERPVVAHKNHKIRNYILGHLELAIPLDGVYKHFVSEMRVKTHKQFMQMVDTALADSVSTGVVSASTVPVWDVQPEKQMVRRIEVC